MVTRKNQKALTAQEWSDFVDAINQTHGFPLKRPPIERSSRGTSGQ